MGYEVHITRQENWYDENESFFIKMEEWKALLLQDDEMSLDDFAETVSDTGETVRIVSEGLAVWIAYSENGYNDNYAWFYYNNGNIIVKNPDEEIINKMIAIARKLNAKVQGDEGEVYDNATLNPAPAKNTVKKPWWKFW